MTETLELSVQEKRNFCVCSVLQAIFRNEGIEMSQKEIARNLTPGKKKFFLFFKKKDGYLVHDERIKKFMESQGFQYIHFGAYETPFNEPDELLKEMSQNYGMIGVGNHVYALKDFDNWKVKMIDPKNGELVETSYIELVREMGHSGVFGLVKHIS